MKHLENTTSFLDRVLGLLSREVQKTLPDLKEAVLKSGKQSLHSIAEDLERWNLMLAAGTLTSQEYAWLVEARVALIQVESLKATGLALVKIDEFRNALARSIVGAALASIGL